MILYKRNNLIFFFIILLCLQKSSQQNEKNKNNNFYGFPNLEQKLNPEEKKKSDDIEEKREKEISLIDENNKLKIKIEVYNIYLYFLISLNSIFFIGLLTFLIYIIVWRKKDNKTNEEEQNEQLVNNEEEKIQEEEIKNATNDSYSINDELLNNSGCEAPPVKGI